MGKRLDDLDDNPLPPRADLAAQEKGAQAFADQIRELEEDETYQFAWGTLVDIRLTVEQTNRATDGQRQAVQNIKDGGDRHQRQLEGWNRRGGSRRYEGFKGKRW